MSTPDRRQFMLGGALLAVSGAASALQPETRVEPLVRGALRRMIPLSIGPYRFATTTGLVVADADGSSPIYDEVLTRIYVAEGLPAIMLLVAYGSAQDSGLALHRPEACYPAVGYQMSASRDVALTGKPGRMATYVSARRGGRVEQIYFWTRIGDRFPATPVAEQLDIFMANLRGIRPDGVLVRLSLVSGDAAAALPQLQSFNERLLAALDPMGRKILLGPERGGDAGG